MMGTRCFPTTGEPQSLVKKKQIRRSLEKVTIPRFSNFLKTKVIPARRIDRPTLKQEERGNLTAL
jgi:hypothetical protein